MKKKDNSWRIYLLFRTFRHVIRITPVAGTVTLVQIAVEGLFPAYATYVSALLFSAAERYAVRRDITVSACLWLTVALIVGYGVKELFLFIVSITMNAGVYEKVDAVSNGRLYKKSAHLPLITYENVEMMDRKRRAEDCVRREILSQTFVSGGRLLLNAIGALSVIAVLATYDWIFVPLSLLSVIPYFIIRILRGQQFYRMKQKQAKKERRKAYLWSLFSDKQATKEMRVMGCGSYLAEAWMAVRDDVNEETWTLTKKDAASMAACDLLRITGYGVCILLAFRLTLSGAISVGVFGACISAFASVQGKTRDFFIELGNLPERIGYVGDYFDFLDLPEEKEEANGGSQTRNNAREAECITESAERTAVASVSPAVPFLAIRNLSFAYPSSRHNAVDDLTLYIQRGEKIAIIGENGSGKTTLVKLLLGMYEQDSGEILVNGTRLTLENRARYLQTASIISQNFVQYHLTLRENVAISDIEEKENDRRVLEALADAEFEGQLADSAFDTQNLDMLLGTDFDGTDLSGGQWQKLAIARGIFRQSQFIVMDEPTSALDPMAEAEILRKFLSVAADKTALIVSHRTGLCTLVDKIVVMAEGRLVEFGTHNDLLAAGGQYARL